MLRLWAGSAVPTDITMASKLTLPTLPLLLLHTVGWKQSYQVHYHPVCVQGENKGSVSERHSLSSLSLDHIMASSIWTTTDLITNLISKITAVLLMNLPHNPSPNMSKQLSTSPQTLLLTSQPSPFAQYLSLKTLDSNSVEVTRGRGVLETSLPEALRDF